MRIVTPILLLVACSGGDGLTDTDEGTPPTDDVTPPTTDTADTDTTVLPPGQCAAVTSVEVTDTNAILQKTLDVTLDAPSEVWATCTATGDPSQVILAESSGAATTHSLLVAGLYADETWSCEIAATCDGATAGSAEIVTSGLPADLHAGIQSQNPTIDPVGQWTLFNSGVSCFGNPLQYLQIVDLEGRVRWAHPVGTGYEVDIDAMWTGDRIHYGGGWGLFDRGEPHRGIVRQVDLAGNELLALDGPQFRLGYNHHTEVLPGGDILSLVASENTGGGNTWDGVGIEQLDPTGTNVVWSWDSQRLFDDGVVPSQTGSPWHNNSVSFFTDSLGEAVYVSLYIGEQIWRIDKATGDRTHVFGPGGDITFVDSAGAPLPASEWTYGQHDPDYRDDRVILYDNGVDRPGGSHSRVAEFQLDLAARTATLLWEWTEDPWYTPIIGDADYVGDDHVLVTKGNVQCLTFWLQQTSSLIEIDQVSSQVAWRYDMADDAVAIFRSERYDGCEIFSNAAACPDVADRVDVLRAMLAR